MKLKKRKFEIRILFEVEVASIKEGMIVAKDTMESLRLKVLGIKPLHRVRTPKQNRALHLYFTQLSEALNNAGFDMKKTIRQDIDIPWTPENVKEYLWRPVQKEMLKKRSTTKLDSVGEIEYIYDIVNSNIALRTGIHIPFPCEQTMIDRDMDNH